LISIEIPVVTDQPFAADYVLTDKKSKSKAKVASKGKGSGIDPGKGMRHKLHNRTAAKPQAPKSPATPSVKSEAAPKKVFFRKEN